jgi:hypothetical protein
MPCSSRVQGGLLGFRLGIWCPSFAQSTLKRMGHLRRNGWICILAFHSFRTGRGKHGPPAMTGPEWQLKNSSLREVRESWRPAFRCTDFTLTSISEARNSSSNLGLCMKYLRWTIVIFGVCFVCLSAIVPRVDSPETAYNETDAPVNLTTSLAAQPNLVTPTVHSVVIPREQREGWEPVTAMHVVTLERGIRVSHSLLDLLCTLLC